MATRRLTALLAVLVTTPSVSAQVPMTQPLHPLDHLTPAEHWTAYEILAASPRTDSTMVIAYVGLHEPPKSEVLTWQPGQSFRREASVHLIQSGAARGLLYRSIVGRFPESYWKVNCSDTKKVPLPGRTRLAKVTLR